MRLSVPFGSLLTTLKQIDALLIEHAQVHEINIGAVKNNDLARFDSGAEFCGANTVGGFGRFDQDKAWQETVQVQTYMKLGGGFAPPVLRPVDARGD